MHPFLRNRRAFALWLFVWLDLGLLLAVPVRLVGRMSYADAALLAVPLALVFGLIALSAWWVCRAAPLARASATRVMATSLGGAVQGSAVWVALGALWGAGLTRTGALHLGRAELLQLAVAQLALGVPLYLVSSVLHYLLLAFEASREAERRVLEAQVSAREAEVRALRAQLDPHFLFNSLNSVNALIGSSPEDARRMCESLGDFLRLTLALGSRELVPLSEELALLERYLAIEHVRFGDRLRIERATEPEAERCLVPPLLLQPLVENAIKHGVADRIEGGRVRIEAHRTALGLEIAVENGVDPDAPPRRGEGVGLENVRRRLATFAAREARLDVLADGERFRVRLLMPAREPAGADAAAPRPAPGAGREATAAGGAEVARGPA